MPIYGICPKCGELKYLTRHHIFPKRFYFKQKHPPIIHICRFCHNEIERLIPVEQKLPRGAYLRIVKEFLGFEECCA